MNKEVTQYILQAPELQQQIMQQLREWIHEVVPSAKESMKWGRPVFSADTDFAYFKTTKSHLSFGFFKIEKIKGNTHLLEGTGKDMRHIKLKKPEDLQPDIIKSWLRQMSS